MGCIIELRHEQERKKQRKNALFEIFLFLRLASLSMENNQNEIEKLDDQNEIRAKNANLTLQSEKSEIQLTNTNCSICNTGLLNEIHALRPTHTFVELAEKINKTHGTNITKDSLSRHFMHYTKQLNTESTKALLAKFDQQVENISEHQKKVLFLCKISFDHIIERLENGTLDLGVEDFEKMMKLYYGTLRDPDSASDNNIIAIFQRASEKYGCSLEQGVLIKTPKSSN